MSLCTDEFEDEGIVEKSVTKLPHIKTDAVSTAGETTSLSAAAVKESRRESRKISVEPTTTTRKRTNDEEYVPQPVRI